MTRPFLTTFRTLLFAIAVLPGMPAIASDPLGWDSPPQSAYPGAFWWWMGSAVTDRELERNIADLSTKGIRTLRLEAIYAAKLSSLPRLQFLSPEWNQSAKRAIEIGKKHGSAIELWGNGWPFGGPWIQPEHASRRLEWDEPLRDVVLDTTKTIVQDGGYPILAVMVTPPGQEAGKALLAREVRSASGPEWAVPPGRWDLYVFRNGYTKMIVKRATPGGKGPVLDHFSTEALTDYLRPFNGLMETVGKGAFGCSHEDSYEVNGANWTGQLPEFFELRRGYDLRPYLSALISNSSDELCMRVRHDYRQTVQEMLVEKHVQPWIDWAHQWGMRTSYQAQGCPGNLVDLYGLADQPDPEAFGREGMASDGLEGRNGGYLCSKFASSSAHLYGRQLVSSETFTWLEDHFCSSLDRMKQDLDYYFLAGINHIYFHSTTYTPSDVPFPGWLYYASVHLDSCQSWWEHAPAFTSSIARTQTVLQQGQPGEDVLLLYPIHDLWFDDRGAKNLLQYCQVHNFTNWCTEVGKSSYEAAVLLWEKGWKFDWCSDRAIADLLKVEGGDLVAGTGRYKTLVIPECRWVADQTPAQVHRLVRAGATVIVIGTPSRSVPVGDPLQAVQDLSKAERLGLFSPRPGEENSGRVLFIPSLEDLPQALKTAGAVREPMADSALLSIRKRLGQDTIYFVKNASGQSFEGWLPVGCSGKSAAVGDPVTGHTEVAETRTSPEGLEIRLRLHPQESRVVRVTSGDYPNSGQKLPNLTESRSETLPGPWKLTWRPLDATGTEITREIDQLVDWREIPELELFSGKVAYRTEFEPGEAAEGSSWVLDLGELHESATVFLNDENLGVVWTQPYRLDLSGKVKPGTNTLRLEVINLLANRVIGLEKEGLHIQDRHLFVNYDYKEFDGAQWEPLASGLLGPVKMLSFNEN